MNELTMINSMLTRLAGAFDWLGIVYVAFMFMVVIWKPNRIVGTGAFRLSVILFAMNVATPALVGFGWNFYKVQDTAPVGQTNPYGGRTAPKESEVRMLYVTQCASEAARIMLGVAIALGILSLLETPHSRRREPGASRPINVPPNIGDPG